MVTFSPPYMYTNTCKGLPFPHLILIKAIFILVALWIGGPIDRIIGMNIALQVCTHTHIAAHEYVHLYPTKEFIYFVYSKVYGSTDSYLFPTFVKDY